MSDPQRPRILDFEQRRSIPSRLWMTFMLALMGAIMLLPYVLLDLPFYRSNPWLAFAVARLFELVEVFVASAIVFVWYRPAWLRRIYLHSERHMSWLYALTRAAMFLALVWLGIWNAFTLIFGR